MSSALLGAYHTWLEPKAGLYRPPDTYSDLLHMMWQKKFVWTVPNDDNRIADGLEVRRLFYLETGAEGYLGPCSFLEVLVGLSKRLAFQADGEPEGWAWQLLCNLELDKMRDPLGSRKVARCEQIMDDVIWRQYAPDGQGSFFPLSWPEGDQRQIEIWYQMAQYVNEIHPEF